MDPDTARAPAVFLREPVHEPPARTHLGLREVRAPLFAHDDRHVDGRGVDDDERHLDRLARRYRFRIRSGARSRSPVRVIGHVRRHLGGGGNLRSAVRRREPAIERVAAARRHRQRTDRRATRNRARRRRNRAAVRVERHRVVWQRLRIALGNHFERNGLRVVALVCLGKYAGSVKFAGKRIGAGLEVLERRRIPCRAAPAPLRSGQRAVRPVIFESRACAQLKAVDKTAHVVSTGQIAECVLQVNTFPFRDSRHRGCTAGRSRNKERLGPRIILRRHVEADITLRPVGVKHGLGCNLRRRHFRQFADRLALVDRKRGGRSPRCAVQVERHRVLGHAHHRERNGGRVVRVVSFLQTIVAVELKRENVFARREVLEKFRGRIRLPAVRCR